MRNKIDYGIDLGTTNSAIARMENGVPTIKKSETLKDTIPSCITFSRKQDILVGDTAYNVLKNDSARALKTFEQGQKNTFIELLKAIIKVIVVGIISYVIIKNAIDLIITSNEKTLPDIMDIAGDIVYKIFLNVLL